MNVFTLITLITLITAIFRVVFASRFSLPSSSWMVSSSWMASCAIFVVTVQEFHQMCSHTFTIIFKKRHRTGCVYYSKRLYLNIILCAYSGFERIVANSEARLDHTQQPQINLSCQEIVGSQINPIPPSLQQCCCSRFFDNIATGVSEGRKYRQIEHGRHLDKTVGCHEPRMVQHHYIPCRFVQLNMCYKCFYVCRFNLERHVVFQDKVCIVDGIIHQLVQNPVTANMQSLVASSFFESL